MREPYEDTMKRLSEDEKHSTYWSHSDARHTQEFERSEERTQQEELPGSMRAEAINNAPIDELNAEMGAEAFEEDLLNDMRGTLLNAVSIIDDIVGDYLQDETPIRVGSVISIKEQLLWVMDAQEKLRS